jgi:hypothetical protein
VLTISDETSVRRLVHPKASTVRPTVALMRSLVADLGRRSAEAASI